MNKKGLLFLSLTLTLFSNCFGGYLDITDLTVKDQTATMGTSGVGYGLSCDWSNDGRYFAISGSTATHQAVISSLDSGSLKFVTVLNIPNCTRIRSIKWSPDGKYLALGIDSSAATPTPVLYLYSFDGTSASFVQSIYCGTGSISVNAVAWSSDGRHLAACGPFIPYPLINSVLVFSFSGTSLSISPVASFDYGANVQSLSWSPDGNYLAIGGGHPLSYAISICSFSGTSLTRVAQDYSSNEVQSVEWSPEGTYLVIGTDNGINDVVVYSFKNNTLNIEASGNAGDCFSVFWSRDGKYIFTGNDNLADNIIIFMFDKSTTTLKTIATKTFGNSGDRVKGVSCNPNGTVLGVTGLNNADDNIYLYNINRYQFNNTINTINNIVYFQNTLFINANQSLTGAVKLLGGINILAGTRVDLDLQYPIYSGADLNEIGTIRLFNNLHLADNFTFTQGGNISGQGYSIFLDGDLIINDNVDLKFTSSTIIDGQGHNLILGHRSQLLVDSLITLTLKNLTLKNTLNTITRPAVKCLDWHGKLALDNVELALNDDFSFYSGQLFIHNDVVFTGTSEFLYRGVRPSYIAPHSKLYFDKGTSFKYYPSNTDKTLIRMNDETSELYFDGCTLKSTFTGLQLTTGSVYFDNKVNVTTAAILDISAFTNGGNPIATSVNYGGFIEALSWSPDGRFVAVGGRTTFNIQVFEFAGSDFANSGNPIATSASYGGSIWALSWSPDGRFIAIGGYNSFTYTVQVFEFTGSGFANGGNPIATSANYGDQIHALSWSPDSRFIAAGGSTAETVQVFEFTGGGFANGGNPVATSVGYGGTIYTLQWSPDSRFISAGGSTAETVQVFEFTGGGFANGGNPIATSVGYGGPIYTLQWSPDSRFISAGGSTAQTVQVFEFTGGGFANGGNPIATSVGYGGTIYTLQWSPDGRFISAGGRTNRRVKVFEFTSGGFANGGNPIATSVSYNGTIKALSWSPDGIFIAVGGESLNRVKVFEPYKNASTQIQASSNSIVFQDLENGIEPDATVKIVQGGKTVLDGPLSIINGGISGGFVFNSTEGFALNDNIYLDSSAYFTQGGTIDGNSHVIFLEDDLTIPENSTLQFIDNIVIDGQEHNLILGHRAQLLIDTLTTLTLRNLTLKTPINSISPAVNTSYYGKLFLDNVTLENNDNFYFYENKSQGEIKLDSNIHLAQNFTFTQGGSISGEGNSIFLDGDVILSDNIELFFTGNTIIDGQGHNLILGHRAQLLIDTLITLTLKNLTLNNTLNTISQPAVKCLDWHGKLALDNVELALNDDFSFYSGQFFIHNDVVFTGTSEFIYRGVRPSYITAHSTLNFDKGTSFKYNPSCTDKTLIRMNNATSALYFDGCTLKSTFTGLQLTTGNVYFDNKVNVTTAAILDISAFTNGGNPIATSVNYGGFIEALSWSPDGRFVAVGGRTTFNIQVFEFAGSDFANSGNPIATSASYGGSIWALSWSPDGRFIAIGGYNSFTYTVQVFEFTGSGFANGGNPIATSANYGDQIHALSWSPDSRFIAAGGSTAETVQVFEFTGGGFANGGNPVATSVGYGGTIYTLQWSPDSRFISAGGSTAETVQVFEFTGGGFANGGNPIATSVGYGGPIYTLQWSPDSRFISAGGSTAQTVQVFEFTGGGFANGGNPIATSVGYGGTIYTLQWSPDGRFISAGGRTNRRVKVFEFTSGGFANGGNPIATSVSYNGTIKALSWSPDGIFIAVGGESLNRVKVFEPYKNASTQIQASSNSIVFQDLENGIEPDATVKIVQGGKTVLDGPLSIINGGISGGFVFNSTEGFALNDNIYLDSSAYFTQGGTIDGNSHVIFLEDDLTIPENSTLQFIDNIVIDGQEHNLILGHRAQLLIDTLTTLTLRNLTLKTPINSISPAVNTSYYGKLFLDNVTLENNDNFYFYENKSQGEIKLDSNIHLAQNFTFTQGGSISGEGNSIFLDGDVILSDNIELFFTGNTIIDGQGHNLILGHRAQLLIDTLITLTLKNLTLNNTLNTISQPAVKCLDWHGKLALDNVELALNDDFSFYSGQFFIHNDVVFTGTSEFIYRGVRPSYITAHSTLNFDKGTSFKYNPSCTDKTLIRMNNATSALYFDGCTLKSTFTGLQLTTGSVYFDNKVNVTSAATLEISDFTNGGNPIATSVNYGGIIETLSWSPNGHFVAAGGSVNQCVEIFEFTGSGFANSGNPIATSVNYGGRIKTLSWSPDEHFVAVGGYANQRVKIFEFTGSGFANSGNPIATSVNYGGSINTLSWSSDGHFVAVGGSVNQCVEIFEFTGSGFANSGNPIATSVNYGGSINTLSWSSDGHFVAAGGSVNQCVEIFEFTGSGFANGGNPIATSTSYGGEIETLSWSSDGRFVAAGGRGANQYVKIFEFTGSGFANGGNPIATSVNYGGIINTLSWSSDGHFVAAGGSVNQCVEIFEFTGSGFANGGNPIATSTSYGGTIETLSWSSDGYFVAAGGSVNQCVEIFEPHLIGSSTTQASSNSIVFQDLENGVEPDASVYALGGSQIILDGYMKL